MAATFERALFHAEGQVIATEGRAKYNQAQRERNYDRYYGLTFWSPNINIFRDPRWGRGQETLGEDPYLTGTLATEFITGLQGDDPRYLKAIATRSEEQTSELQSLMRISSAVFCLKKKK